MGYQAALSKGWQELDKIAKEKKYSLRYLAEDYYLDLKDRCITLASSNTKTKDYAAILILHYLTQRLKGLPLIQNEWISFKQLAGSLGYYPTFKKRVIDRINKKYESNPEGLLEKIEHLDAKKTQLADISIVLNVFESVPVLITMWRADAEFGSEINIHYDKSIKDILCTEDIVVMSEFIASKI